MFSHDDIWRGIDRLAAGLGYSPSGLAKKAGLDPTSFNKSKRVGPDGKPRWPSTESLSKILSVTGSTMSDFISLISDETSQPRCKIKAQRTIPLIGFAQAGRKGYFDEDGYPAGNGWDEINFPDKAESGAHTYALQVTGSSMEPLYRAGDKLIIAPGAPVRRGDRVVVKIRSGEVMAKELTKQSSTRVELHSFNPSHDPITISPNEIKWMARIMWVSQ